MMMDEKKDKASEFVAYHSREEAESQKWSEQAWLRPFVNGGLAGFLPSFASYMSIAAIQNSPVFIDIQRNHKYANFIFNAQNHRNMIVIRTLSKSLLLGLFENKAIVRNDGTALTLYEEAACGLTAGAAEAFFRVPLSSACLPTLNLKNLSVVRPAEYRNIFQALYSMAANKSVLELWASSGSNVMIRTASNVGMLASYNPTICYLMDSHGLSERRAQIGASVVSAFFATACYVPVANVLALRKYGYDPLNYLISRPLTLMKGFSRVFAFCGLPIVTMWFAFEHVRKIQS